MNLIRAIVIELLVQALILTLQLSAAEYAWRTNPASPGSTVYFWFPQSNGKTEQPTVPAGWTVSFPGDYTIGDWHWQWAWAVHIPAKTMPGTYTVGHRQVMVGNIARTSRPRLIQRVAPGQSLAAARAAVIAGRDILLDPGLHTWNGSLSVPNGTTITGYHATIQRTPNGEYAERMFVPSGSMTLEGLTLTHSCDDWPVYIHTYLEPPTSVLPGQITVKNCTLQGGELIRCFQSRNLLVQNCRFIRAGTGQVPSASVWDSCDFIGHTRTGQHTFFNTGADGILVVNCTWTGTNRGIVFQTGPCRGALVANCYFTGIRGGEANANEVILMEAGTDGRIEPGEGMRDNTFLDVQITDSAGPAISLFGSGMAGNRFWSVVADIDNTSLMVAALNGGRITDNEFHNFQTTGGLDFRGNIGKVTLGNLQLFERPQMAGNQGPFTPVLKHFNEHWPFHLDDLAKEKGVFSFYGSNLWKADRSQVAIEGVQ